MDRENSIEFTGDTKQIYKDSLTIVKQNTKQDHSRRNLSWAIAFRRGLSKRTPNLQQFSISP